SSPGLAFLLATISTYGENGWQDYWKSLRRNDVLVSQGWEEAYYGAFSGGSGEGDRPIVVSYASSPPAEVFFADPQPKVAPTGVVTEGCFAQIEFAGILDGTDNRAGAELFIDFLLSETFQADMPLQMFVFPVVDRTPLPAVFEKHAAVVTKPVTVPPATIAANREAWIKTWTEIVLG
ncbi:MAG: thiamine ABC transporter substrate-binding protein, partial [Acidimicrobiales bacterium]